MAGECDHVGAGTQTTLQERIANLQTVLEIAALGGGGAGGLLGSGKSDVVGVRPEADLERHGNKQAEQQGGQRGLDGCLGGLAASSMAQWNDGSKPVTWVATALTIGLNSV